MRCIRPIWNCAKVVISDSVFYVTKGLVELWRKDYLELRSLRSADISRQISRVVQSMPTFSSKGVGNVDAVKQVGDKVDYHLFLMKEPDCVMKLMTTYGALEPKDKRTRRKFKRG